MAKKKKNSKKDSSRDKINEDLDNIKQNGNSSESFSWFSRLFVTCYMIMPDSSSPNEDDSDDSDKE